MKRPDPVIWTPDAPGLQGLFPDPGTPFSAHREKVKRYLLAIETHCMGCGKRLPPIPHMHEGIISRRDVMGWPKRWRVLCITVYSCTLLHPDCNWGLSGKSPPSREKVLRLKVHEYGVGVVVWLRSLPFKAHPLAGLLEGYPYLDSTTKL